MRGGCPAHARHSAGSYKQGLLQALFFSSGDSGLIGLTGILPKEFTEETKHTTAGFLSQN